MLHQAIERLSRSPTRDRATWTLICVCAALATSVPGCTSARQAVFVPPPPAQVVTIGITVRDPDGTPLDEATGSLTPDEQPTSACENLSGRLLCPTTATGGADLEVSADGFVGARLHIALDPNQEDLYLERVGGAHLERVDGARAAPSLPRLMVDGRVMRKADGQLFNWRSISAFRLLDLVASGLAAEVDEYLGKAAAAGLTMVRVFSMAGNCCNSRGEPLLFRLEPERGRAALPRLLELAARHGLYVELVALLDTKFYTFDHAHHVRVIGETCRVWSNCVVELANEPDHATQVSGLADPAALGRLRNLVPPDVPVAYGAAHGGDDESRRYIGGDYVTVHGDRDDACGTDDRCWRAVRHTKEQRALSEEIGKFVVNDEPSRTLKPDQYLAMALLCRILGLGDTHHYAGGLHARWPQGQELEAFDARRRGWDAIPPDWIGSYRNVGHADSPVSSADWSTVVRVYSSIRGSDAYTLALGGSDPRFTWSPAWPHRELVLREGGTTLWRLTR